MTINGVVQNYSEMPKKKGGGRKNGSRGEGGEPKPDKKAIEKQLKLLCDQANSLHDTAEQASTADQKLTVLQQSYAVYEDEQCKGEPIVKYARTLRDGMSGMRAAKLDIDELVEESLGKVRKKEWLIKGPKFD